MMASDIVRQNETLPEGLSASQGQAITALLTGASVTAAAQAAGVSRATLHRWLADDPDFIAAYNLARSEVADAVRRELTFLAVEAVGVVRSVLTDAGTPAALRFKAALEVLKAAAGEPIGPTDPEEARFTIKRRDRDRMFQSVGIG